VRALHRDSFVALAVGHYAPTQIAAHDALIADLAYADDPARSHVTLARRRPSTVLAARLSQCRPALVESRLSRRSSRRHLAGRRRNARALHA